jgi:hypothetical protein
MHKLWLHVHFDSVFSVREVTRCWASTSQEGSHYTEIIHHKHEPSGTSLMSKDSGAREDPMVAVQGQVRYQGLYRSCRRVCLSHMDDSFVNNDEHHACRWRGAEPVAPIITAGIS